MDTAEPIPAASRRKKPTKKAGATFKGFVHLGAAEASRAQPTKIPRALSSIYTKYLFLTDDQRGKIDEIHAGGKITSQEFEACEIEQQLTAAALLASYRLDIESRECLANKWVIRWSREGGEGPETAYRVLYQWYVP